MYQALLLDVGHVIIDISWRVIDAYDAVTGTTEPGRDRSRPESDARWQEHVAGTITADRYWDQVARSRGMDGLIGLFRALAEVVPGELFDRDAVALMRDARTARLRVGVLSNDAYSLLGNEFFAGRPELAALDAFVDSTEVGARKPAPEAYLAAAAALAVAPEGIVFLDDTPECVEGARRVGMVGIHVDPFDRTPAFARARRLLRLTA
jgi:putative hydrolase of the HAD superfamily